MVYVEKNFTRFYDKEKGDKQLYFWKIFESGKNFEILFSIFKNVSKIFLLKISHIKIYKFRYYFM